MMPIFLGQTFLVDFHHFHHPTSPQHGSVSKPIVPPSVHIKIAWLTWMFIPLTNAIFIGIDPYPYWILLSYSIVLSHNGFNIPKKNIPKKHPKKPPAKTSAPRRISGPLGDGRSSGEWHPPAAASAASERSWRLGRSPPIEVQGLNTWRKHVKMPINTWKCQHVKMFNIIWKKVWKWFKMSIDVNRSSTSPAVFNVGEENWAQDVPRWQLADRTGFRFLEVRDTLQAPVRDVHNTDHIPGQTRDFQLHRCSSDLTLSKHTAAAWAGCRMADGYWRPGGSDPHPGEKPW